MFGLLAVALAGFGAQLVDGSLGMGYGLTSSTLLIAIGLAPAMASASVHLAEIGTTAAVIALNFAMNANPMVALTTYTIAATAAIGADGAATAAVGSRSGTAAISGWCTAGGSWSCTAAGRGFLCSAETGQKAWTTT